MGRVCLQSKVRLDSVCLACDSIRDVQSIEEPCASTSLPPSIPSVCSPVCLHTYLLTSCTYIVAILFFVVLFFSLLILSGFIARRPQLLIGWPRLLYVADTDIHLHLVAVFPSQPSQVRVSYSCSSLSTALRLSQHFWARIHSFFVNLNNLLSASHEVRRVYGPVRNKADSLQSANHLLFIHTPLRRVHRTYMKQPHTLLILRTSWYVWVYSFTIIRT